MPRLTDRQDVRSMRGREVTRRAEPESDTSWMKRGREIEEEAARIAAEAERRAEQRKRTGGLDPNKFRFRLALRESAEVVILDTSPDTVAFNEHQLRKDGHWGYFESCPGDWSNCPLCSAGENKSFVWFLTVLDLRGYTKDDGTKVPYFRRLLPIKHSQAPLYKRVLAAAKKEHGTIRGTVLLLERDTNERSSGIGEPAVLDSGKMYDYMTEEELEDEFGHDPIKSAKDGSVLVKRNGLLEPFDYGVIFPKPDAADIARRWGLTPPAGSEEEYRRTSSADREEPVRGSRVADSRRSLIDSLYELADGADENEDTGCPEIESEAEAFGIVANNYPTWREVVDAIAEHQDSGQQRASRSYQDRVDAGEDDDPPPSRTRRGRLSAVEDEDDLPTTRRVRR